MTRSTSTTTSGEKAQGFPEGILEVGDGQGFLSRCGTSGQILGTVTMNAESCTMMDV